MPILPGFDSAGKIAKSATKAAEGTEGTAAAGGSSFADLLTKQLDGLNAKQGEAAKLTQDLAAGNSQDVAQTMMRIEEASVSMRMATQVRNKAIDAYQEIMRMQI